MGGPLPSRRRLPGVWPRGPRTATVSWPFSSSAQASDGGAGVGQGVGHELAERSAVARLSLGWLWGRDGEAAAPAADGVHRCPCATESDSQEGGEHHMRYRLPDTRGSPPAGGVSLVLELHRPAVRSVRQRHACGGRALLDQSSGSRSFVPAADGGDGGVRRSVRPFMEEVVQLHETGHSLSAIQRRVGIAWKSVAACSTWRESEAQSWLVPVHFSVRLAEAAPLDQAPARQPRCRSSARLGQGPQTRRDSIRGSPRNRRGRAYGGQPSAFGRAAAD